MAFEAEEGAPTTKNCQFIDSNDLVLGEHTKICNNSLKGFEELVEVLRSENFDLKLRIHLAKADFRKMRLQINAQEERIQSLNEEIVSLRGDLTSSQSESLSVCSSFPFLNNCKIGAETESIERTSPVSGDDTVPAEGSEHFSISEFNNSLRMVIDEDEDTRKSRKGENITLSVPNEKGDVETDPESPASLSKQTDETRRGDTWSIVTSPGPPKLPMRKKFNREAQVVDTSEPIVPARPEGVINGEPRENRFRRKFKRNKALDYMSCFRLEKMYQHSLDLYSGDSVWLKKKPIPEIKRNINKIVKKIKSRTNINF